MKETLPRQEVIQRNVQFMLIIRAIYVFEDIASPMLARGSSLIGILGSHELRIRVAFRKWQGLVITGQNTGGFARVRWYIDGARRSSQTIL